MSNIVDILTELNYPCKDMGSYINTKALWRGGDDMKSVAIYKDTNLVVDYVTGQRFPFANLVKLIVGDSTDSKITSILDKANTVRSSQKPVVRQPKKFNKLFLDSLTIDYSYWKNRGISEETLKTFGGGVCNSGKLYKRYVFPVFDSKRNLIGVSARDLINDPENEERPKWKHLGDKTNWKYPLSVNYEIIRKSKQVILVESIGDMLSLWEAGVKNVFVTFGVVLFPQVISLLIKMDSDEIVVAFNNEPNNKNIGNRAASKAISKLLNFFDEKQVILGLPTKKDFNDMTTEEILKWHANLH